MDLRLPRVMLSAPVLPVALFLSSAAGFAAATSYLAWIGIPYQKLERYTREQEFIVWEGVVWLIALLLIFLGSSIIVERAGWRIGSSFRELRRRLLEGTQSALLHPEVLPWWMLTAGGIFMVIGSVARATIAP